MKTTSFVYFLVLCITCFGFMGREKDTLQKTQQTIRIYFHHKLGNEILVLGQPVKTILGEDVVIEKFKYYVSNFSVTDNKGHLTQLPVQYFLIDEADSLSKKIELQVPDTHISSIQFLLGVDSVRNVSGVQTGALDPLKGMFWTWNSGYIMAKLEGSSALAATAGHRFTYHVGGFKKETNTSRLITLPLSTTGNPVQEINVSTDINRWFKGNSVLSIADTPMCHSPGALAMKIADNYRDMFSINAVH